MAAVLQKIEASIEAQRKKLEQLKAKKQQIEAREKTKLQGETRKRETRQKILLGSFLMEQCRKNGIGFALVTYENASLDKWLTRADDRALFGLPPLPVEAKATEVNPSAGSV